MYIYQGAIVNFKHSRKTSFWLSSWFVSALFLPSSLLLFSFDPPSFPPFLQPTHREPMTILTDWLTTEKEEKSLRFAHRSWLSAIMMQETCMLSQATGKQSTSLNSSYRSWKLGFSKVLLFNLRKPSSIVARLPSWSMYDLSQLMSSDHQTRHLPFKAFVLSMSPLRLQKHPLSKTRGRGWLGLPT